MEVVAWINERGVIYRYPKSTKGLRPLVFGDITATDQDALRYRAFRRDILTKNQNVMTEVAKHLTGPACSTTPDMVDEAFTLAMKKYP